MPMERGSVAEFNVDAELPMAMGRVRVVRQSWAAPIDNMAVTPLHHLELSLLPRSDHARACFPAHWGPHRFEPIGELFLFPAQQLVHAKSDCRHQNSISFDFDPELMAKWVDCNPEWTDKRLRACLDIVSHDIRNLLFRIGEEARAPGLAARTMIELMAMQAAIELSRHILNIDEEKAIGGLSPWRLRLIEERLTSDITPPTVTELAAMCNISVRHLTRAFRVSRGRAIGSYVLEHRMNHAKKLIETGMNIKSVSQAMDFTASSNFTAAFRRATGETPRDYRQRVSRSMARPLAHIH
ncbi:AraC family transcriptional regulator [Acidocella sp.]|uniref:helix-turn-helix transcriptional regulator n=1 Tax=Acidocella sp. TaxID=50710 RepID=UPI0026186AA4|nr:AraC family transcriptional regulator [Acidocella sp.]